MAGHLTPEFATISLRLVRLPIRAVLVSAHDRAPQTHRELVYVAVHTDAAGPPIGWGECSALNSPSYTAEWARGAYDLLAQGRSIEPDSAPMATAALQMAVLDADLRAAGLSLAERLGTAGRSAPAGAVVGLEPIPAMVEQIAALVTAGYRRVKCKIAPGRVVEPIRTVRDAFPDLEIQVDANGSLGSGDLGSLRALSDLGVQAVEQPFPVGDNALGARLVAESQLTVVADEAVMSVEDLQAIVADQAANAVAVKPARVGGLQAALDILETAAALGLDCSIGGMLESGLGRHQLAAMAPLAHFTITGDLSPAGRWLAADPFTDIEMQDGLIAAPRRIGVAGSPDLDVLDDHTIASTAVPASALLRSLS